MFQPGSQTTKDAPWSATRLGRALSDRGVFSAAISPNAHAWFIMVQPYVVRGECSFEHFVATFDMVLGSRKSLELALATYKQPASTS